MTIIILPIFSNTHMVDLFKCYTLSSQNQQTMKMKIDNLEENDSRTRYRNRIAIVHTFQRNTYSFGHGVTLEMLKKRIHKLCKILDHIGYYCDIQSHLSTVLLNEHVSVHHSLTQCAFFT